MSALEVELGYPLLGFSLLFQWVKTFVLHTLTSPELWCPQHLAQTLCHRWLQRVVGKRETNIAESLVCHNIAFSFSRHAIGFFFSKSKKKAIVPYPSGLVTPWKEIFGDPLRKYRINAM